MSNLGLRSFLFAAGVALAVAGCGSRVAYSPPAAAPVDERVTLPGSFNAAWGAVIQTFFQRNIPVRTLEKASGLLESDELQAEIGRECDCGSWLGVPIAGYGAYGGDAHYRFRVLVERKDDSTTLLTVRSSCRARTDRIEGDLVCRLDPAKEAELRAAIAERLGASRSAAH